MIPISEIKKAILKDLCFAYYHSVEFIGILPSDINGFGKSNGKFIWYKDGKIHREGAPAIINTTHGDKSWVKDGLLHREDGPAAEYENGMSHFYLNGKIYSEADFKKIMAYQE